MGCDVSKAEAAVSTSENALKSVSRRVALAEDVLCWITSPGHDAPQKRVARNGTHLLSAYTRTVS